MVRPVLSACIMLLFLLVGAGAGQAQPAAPRVALVVGNASYGASFGALANPVNDARTVAAALRSAGFEVEMVADADQRTLKQAISRFGQRLNAAGNKATGLFYYAGHGVQSRGDNYLIPVKAEMASEADLDLDGINANAVLSQMQDAGISTSIVILDACRNMPLTRSFRSGTRGLARMDAPNGSYIAYSTAPGQTAADGSGANSPFASAFAREVASGQPIDAMFTNIRRAVSEATAGTQTPWSSSSLLHSVSLGVAGAAGVPVAGAAMPALVRPAAAPADVAKLVAECDRLAGDPTDLTFPAGATGILWDKDVLPALAGPACNAAYAAAPDNARMIHNLGRVQYKLKDYAEARRYFELAATRGQAIAMAYIGVLHARGDGVVKDDAEAKRWYEQAAVLGDPSGMTALGFAYFAGSGIAQDYGEARRWLEKAVEKSPDAMLGMGRIYELGLGVAKDAAQARQWYERAVQGGSTGAMNNLGAMYMEGAGGGKDVARAMQLLEQGAANGNATAMTSLGNYLWHGKGIRKDRIKARRYYEQAAALGHQQAKESLDFIIKSEGR